MSLKIKNKDGKTIARLEDDFSEPEIVEEEACNCKPKCKKCKHDKALEELTQPIEEDEE